MLEAIRFLAPAFAACLVLAGIHVYLGQHVLARGVIFVDLSLAQLAALGSTLAVAIGFEHESWQGHLASFLLALIGAALFSVTRSHSAEERVPQEATIGIAYAVSASLVMLVAAKIPHGSDELERVLLGNVLWVTWPKIRDSVIVYGLLGLIHWIFRRPFLEVTFEPQAAIARGRRVRLIDFFFYLTFAIAITQSVPLAGVLLVFTLLVVPAAAGALLADGLGRRLAVGWAFAVVGSAGGIAASWLWDVPTGAAIVTSLGLLLLLLALGRALAGRLGRA